MAQALNLNALNFSTRPKSSEWRFRREDGKRQSWSRLQKEVKCNPKFSCLFSGSSREEQAKKALESALGEKKNEFEKWNNEIKKREEVGGGGFSGGGGWFGSGGRFNWFSGDNFWPEAQQTGLTVLGIIAMYLIVAKGEVILAVILNPLLYALRGTRTGLTLISSRLRGKKSQDGPAGLVGSAKKEVDVRVSAKERVLRKWGTN